MSSVCEHTWEREVGSDDAEVAKRPWLLVS